MVSTGVQEILLDHSKSNHEAQHFPDPVCVVSRSCEVALRDAESLLESSSNLHPMHASTGRVVEYLQDRQHGYGSVSECHQFQDRLSGGCLAKLVRKQLVA